MRLFVLSLSFIATGFAATSITQNTITVTFDADYTVGQYATGDYYVVAPSGLDIDSISPAFTDAGGHSRNGAMVNPTAGISVSQGFDSEMRAAAYSAALNIADDLPYTASAGESIIFTVSESSPLQRPQLTHSIVLTVVASAPAADSFRPAYAGTDKTVHGTLADLDYSFFHDLTPPNSGTNVPSLATVETYFPGSFLEIVTEWGGEYDNATNNQAESYGRDMSHLLNEAWMSLHLDYSDAQKETLYMRLVQYGIDIWGAAKAGGQWRANGGHNMGRKLPLLLAGKVFNNSEMLAYADATQNLIFQEDQQSFYVTQTEVDLTNGPTWDPDTRSPTTPYQASDIGIAEWGIRHSYSPEEDNAHWGAIYRSTNGSNWVGIALAAHLFGWTNDWNHPAFFDYSDRYWSNEESNRADSPNFIHLFVADMWDEYRSQGPPTSTSTTVTIATALTPGAGATSMVDGLVIGLVPGQSVADVEFKGTASAADDIQVRILRQSDSSVVQDWTYVATTVGSGSWSGTIGLPKADEWWKAEVRPKGNPSAVVTLSEKFAVGYKVVLLGQSQMRRMMVFGSVGNSMSAGNVDTVSFYTLDGGESVDLLDNSTNGTDGLRAFVEQFRNFDATTPVMLVQEAVSGTSIIELLDDSETDRDWSDLTDKTDKYGGDISVVVESWVTSNDSPLAGNEGIDLLQGIDDHGFSVDHSFADVFQSGYAFAEAGGTRHALDNFDGYEAEIVDRANELGYAVGPPISDYEIEDGGSAHANDAGQGNIRLGTRLAVTVARALGLDTSENPSLNAGYRSFDGTILYLTFNLPNGGTLYSPAPTALSGFEISENSGSSWSGSGFTTGITGDYITLTKDSGTWATAGSVQIRKLSNLADDVSIVEAQEQALVDGELYETWSDDALGLGLPVHGVLDGGDWTFPPEATVTSIAQLGDGELPPEAEPTVANVTFSSPAGNYGNPISVELSTLTDGASIQYSTDGVNYSSYSTAIDLSSPTTIYAKATKTGFADSAVTSSSYTFATYVSIEDIFVNIPIPEEDTSLTVTFSATCYSQSMDGFIGFGDGAAETWSDAAYSLQHYTNDEVRVRNAGSYENIVALTYTEDVSNDFRVEIDLVANTVDVWMDGVQIADDYARRTGNTDDVINNISLWTDDPEGHGIADLSIGVAGSSYTGQLRLSGSGTKPSLSGGARFKLN